MSASDIEFLEDAESEGAVQKLGLIYEKKTSQIVREWAAATFEGQPPEWSIWFGQPANSDSTPKELVEANPPKGFVMFVNHPSRRLRRATEKCFRISNSGGHVHFHQIHPE